MVKRLQRSRQIRYAMLAIRTAFQLSVLALHRSQLTFKLMRLVLRHKSKHVGTDYPRTSALPRRYK